MIEGKFLVDTFNISISLSIPGFALYKATPPCAAFLPPITSGGRDEQQLGLLEAETRARRPGPVLLALIGRPLPTAQG